LAGGGVLIWRTWLAPQSDVEPVRAAPTKARAPGVPKTSASRPTGTNKAHGDDESSRTDSAALEKALAEGLGALEALSTEFPDDPEIWVVLSRERVAKKQYTSALEAAQRALSIRPETSQDGRIASVMWLVAQSRASKQAFQTLRDMQARGADIALDLATTGAVRKRIRDRARAQLESSWFEAQATPDTSIAAALFLAQDCASVKRQLARATAQGRRRTLQRLEALQQGKGCAKRTGRKCGSCVRDNREFYRALAATRSRLAALGE
jgi:hypothetical protein